MPLHVFDHDDGVVHHEADGEHEAEQADRVDGEAHCQQERQRSDQRDGDGDGRNERRAPVLQEDEDNTDHQGQCLEQRDDDLLDRRRHEERGVVGNLVGDIVGKALRQDFHLGPDLIGHVERIGVGELIHREECGWLSVQFAEPAVVLGPELYPGDILERDHGAVRLGHEDDVLELRNRVETPLGGKRVLELLRLRGRRRAERTGRRLNILLANCRDDVGCRQPQARHPVGLQPDAHTVVIAAPIRRPAQRDSPADFHVLDW